MTARPHEDVRLGRATRAARRSRRTNSSRRRSLEECNGLCREPLATTGEPEEVCCGRADIDRGWGDIERCGDPSSHLFAVWRNAWLLADHNAVRAHKLVAGRSHLPIRTREQDERVGATVVIVIGGEQRADVGKAGGAEQRIRECVRNDIAVGVSGETPRVIYRNAAEHEWDSGFEGMCIDAKTDPQTAHRSEASACGSEAR